MYKNNENSKRREVNRREIVSVQEDIASSDILSASGTFSEFGSVC